MKKLFTLTLSFMVLFSAVFAYVPTSQDNKITNSVSSALIEKLDSNENKLELFIERLDNLKDRFKQSNPKFSYIFDTISKKLLIHLLQIQVDNDNDDINNNENDHSDNNIEDNSDDSSNEEVTETVIDSTTSNTPSTTTTTTVTTAITTIPYGEQEDNLNPDWSMKFDHDFSGVGLSSKQQQDIENFINLTLGNILTYLKQEGVLRVRDIGLIKDKKITYRYNGAMGTHRSMHRRYDMMNNILQFNTHEGFTLKIILQDIEGDDPKYFMNDSIQRLLFHEVGHYVDIVKWNTSNDFYNICRKLKQRNNLCDDAAFISDSNYYSKTNLYEDFAETFKFYYYNKFIGNNIDTLNGYEENINDDMFNKKLDHMQSLKLSYDTIRDNSCLETQNLVNGDCINNTAVCDISNGRGKQIWENGQPLECEIIRCDEGYIKEGEACVEKTIDCYGNTHYESGSCVSNTRICEISNGYGTQQVYGNILFGIPLFNRGPCINLVCDTGYKITYLGSDGDPATVDYGCGPE